MDCSAGNLTVTPYDFGKKLFPPQVDGKLNTKEFLEASNDVVKLIDKMGMVFSPLSRDISGNIEKIKTCYSKNPEKYIFIEDLILCAIKESNNSPIDALLWLRRALHFVLIFFQNILNDSRKNECLEEHMASAYSQALEPYHGWMSRKLFKFFKNMVPNRTALFSTLTPDVKEEEKEKLVTFLQTYIQSLADNVHHITSFYKEHNLDSNAKV